MVVIANRRMFSLTITNSDLFLEMPSTSQNLYFHLGMNADDDGFVQAISIMKQIGANNDDLKVLLTKGFLIKFKDGVIVITAWKVNNRIRADRHKETFYVEHLKQLSILENECYLLDNSLATIPQPDDNQMGTQVRLGKVSIGKVSKEKSTSFVKPTIKEIQEYCTERNNSILPNAFYDFYESKGWAVGRNKMKDWRACVRTWENREPQEKTREQQIAEIEALKEK